MSSTSIYPKESRKISYDENENLDDSTVGNQILLRAESIFQKNNSFDSTVIRFGGLMGEDRVPLNYFSGKENVDGESRVNYIHQSDAIGIVEWTLSTNLWNRTFNAVAPIHPKKKISLVQTQKN
jgi:NAD dependent epimerase/dehydratase family enzyme